MKHQENGLVTQTMNRKTPTHVAQGEMRKEKGLGLPTGRVSATTP